MFEHSQEQIRLAAQRAREELRDPSPSPERPVQKRERTDILGYMKRLEELENPRVVPNNVVPEKKKAKRQRVRKIEDVEPKTVHEAILKHLEEPAATNIKKKEDADDDIFQELWGGPGQTEGGEGDDLDFMQQFELDLSEL